MKVALVIKEFTENKGGGERYAVNLARGLLKRGHEVHIFTHRFDKDIAPGLIYHPVAMLTSLSFAKVVSFAWLCRRELQKENFDIIYGLTQVYPQDIHRLGGGLQRFWRQRKGHSSSLSLLSLAQLFLEKQILKPTNFHLIVTNSQMCRQQILKLYSLPPERVEVIYNGVDTVRFSPQIKEKWRDHIRGIHGLRLSDTVILFASNNFARKGLDTVITALAELGRQRCPYSLIVAGAGKPARYLSRAQAQGLDSQVIFAGPAPAIEAYYGAADIFVLPTLYDPFANVCLEALACGLPVITSKYNGVAEILGEAGLVMDNPQDSWDLAKKLLYLAEPKIREKMGALARQLALGFSWEENVRQTEALFLRVVEEKKKENN